MLLAATRSIVTSVLLLCTLNHLTSAQMYGLLFNHQIPSSGSIKSSRALLTEDRTLNDQPHVEGSRRYEARNGAESMLIRCKQDSDCIDDNSPGTPENLMYCDRHYGFCDYFRQVDELCRHDSQCDAGLICMFGKCALPSAPGQLGARCTDASDCNPGLCCARQHGERLCKSKLKIGQQCFVPLGGLDYSLNELCPCDEGLECQRVKAKTSPKSKRKRHFKSEEVMRCTLNKSPS